MKKIKIDTEKCIGCGACAGTDPEHFDINDEGVSFVVKQEDLDSSDLQDAIDACPVGIISIVEENDEVIDEVIDEKKAA